MTNFDRFLEANPTHPAVLRLLKHSNAFGLHNKAFTKAYVEVCSLANAAFA